MPLDALPPLPLILNRHHIKGPMPPGTVYVGRGEKWGNPFMIGRDGDRAEVIEKHGIWIATQPRLLACLPELEGRDLICWCAPAACHGCTLRWLANPSLRPRLDAGTTEQSTYWQHESSAPENGDEFYYWGRGRVRVGSLGHDLGGSIRRDPTMTAWHPKTYGDDPPSPPPANLKVAVSPPVSADRGMGRG
jgi:hypothetical protein